MLSMTHMEVHLSMTNHDKSLFVTDSPVGPSFAQIAGTLGPWCEDCSCWGSFIAVKRKDGLQSWSTDNWNICHRWSLTIRKIKWFLNCMPGIDVDDDCSWDREVIDCKLWLARQDGPCVGAQIVLVFTVRWVLPWGVIFVFVSDWGWQLFVIVIDCSLWP